MSEDVSIWLRLRTNLQSAAQLVANTASISNIFGLTWVIIWVVLCVIVAQDLVRDVVTVEPISVPRMLSDGGYTPEVASHRMLDAVKHYATVNKASSIMEALNISPRDDLPDFVVPRIDLSLNTLVSSIRSVLHYGTGRRISGEFLFRDKLALRVRVDGHQVFSSGFDSDNPDDLLAKAAPSVIEQIQPYIAALASYHDHPEEALEKADEIIARAKETDVNVQRAYTLKGTYLYEHGNYAESEKMLRAAIKLNWSSWVPHNDLGRALQRQGRFDEAVAQYHRAIELNPKSAVAHNNLGYALAEKGAPNGKLDDAIAELRHAIELDRRYPLPHNNLGLELYREGKIDEAINEYHRAIQLDSKYANPHANLGVALYHQHKIDDAAAEYRQAIEIDPKNLIAHNGLALVLVDQGRTEEGVAEYRRAIEIDPNNKLAHRNLEKALAMSPALNTAAPAKE